MLPLYRSLITNQFDAALGMLAEAVEKCPDELWHEPVAEWKFCQVAFHALFYTDVYLSTTYDAVREQPFHKDHIDDFAGYEEFHPEPPQSTYKNSSINAYLQHCRDKAKAVLAAETEESLARRPGFDWLDFSRAEVHVYNIRHIHHHAAQLSLHLRLKIGDGVAWHSSGWSKVNDA